MSGAGVTFSFLKRLQKFSAKCSSSNLQPVQPNHHIMNLTRREDCVHPNLPINSLSQAYFKGELPLPVIFAEKQLRTITSGNINLLNIKHSASFSPNNSRFCRQKALPFASNSVTLLLNHRSYSSSLRDSTDVSDWAHDLTPCAQQLLDLNPFLVISVEVTLTVALIAWIVMPVILRKLHQYSIQIPAATPVEESTNNHSIVSGERLPYEKSFWGALEDPVRYLVIFVAFSHICVMVAPTNEALQPLVGAWKEAETWKKAAMASFTWSLHKWKKNFFEHISSSQSFVGHDGQHNFLTLRNVSSAGVLGIGGTMAFADIGGISVQSFVFVGGIGGFAAAIAARHVLANVYSGLSMQISKPFTVGDTIKAGSVEGEVIEMGATKTSLMNAKKLAVVVPNSYFCKQVVVIKSRADCRGMISRIRLRIEAIHRIDKISDEIRSMLKENGNVLLRKGAPYCYLSHIDTSYAELTLGYNLKPMGKYDICSAEEDILEKAGKILKRHDADLSSSSSSSDSDDD